MFLKKSTNFSKINNHLSLKIIEHKKTMLYDVGNYGTGMEQAHNVAVLYRLMKSHSLLMIGFSAIIQKKIITNLHNCVFTLKDRRHTLYMTT